ncbi:MAG: hypothetical protein NTAFB09_05990 [Nitrosospira sp.]
MKFSSASTVRSSASALILAGTVLLGISGIANAQYGGASGQTKENPAGYSGSDKGKETGSKKGGQKEKYYGMQKDKEEMDTGYVDQKKRVDRSKDAVSPPDFPRDKEGKPIKDLKDEQGGSIGPN